MDDIIKMTEIKLTEEEISAALAVLESGDLRQGQICANFEKRFAEKVGAKQALTCSSGTAALHLAYLVCLQPGDEVLVPAFTFIATASMVTMSGAKPVFCDVDKKAWVIDLEDAERKITDKTKAIAPVHLFGNACPVDAVNELASKYNLYVVWDAAQAHGTIYKGKDIGGLNDFVCYSFYPTKNMFTGEGGMVTTNSLDFAEKIKFMRTHGQTDKYIHTMLGLNYRMTDVEAAIGLKQLDRLDEMLAIRRKNGDLLATELNQIEGLTPQQLTEDCEHSYHQFCVLVDAKAFGMDRDELAARLKDKAVATGVHYPRGLHQQPVFEELYGPERLPGTELLCEQILALPVHHGLTEEQCRRIAGCIKDFSR
jgi:perosamine synthetase